MKKLVILLLLTAMFRCGDLGPSKAEQIQRLQMQSDSIANIESFKQDSLANAAKEYQNAVNNIPADVIQKMKQNAQEKYPNDYRLQEVDINEQIDAYLRLNN